MPGSHLVYSVRSIARHKIASALKELLYRENVEIRELISEEKLNIACSAYDGYPFRYYRNETYAIFLEGMIYNRSESDVESSLRSIAAECHHKGNYEKEALEFVNSSDGDFLVTILIEPSGELLIFNDRWGRLQTFYSSSDESFALSREIKYILHWISPIVFDPIGMAEFLTLEYNLGRKTLFKGIERMKASSLIKVSRSPDKITVRYQALLPLDFEFEDKGLNRRESLGICNSLFNESLKNRVEKVSQAGLEIVADLSGGYDTRALFIGLCNLGAPFQACHDRLVTGDESAIAHQVAMTFKRDLFCLYSVHPVDDLSIIRRVTYLTDCLVNCWVDVSGFYDELERERVIRNTYAHFMGLGGEFIRNVYHRKSFYTNLADMLSDDAFTHFFRISDACFILGIRPTAMEDNFSAETGLFPESNLRDQVRHLYFESYSKVDNAGENRHRLFNWTVTPFWGKDFFHFAVKNIRPEYISYQFFVDFLRQLHPDALEIPIHGRRLSLNHPAGRLALGAERRIKAIFRDNRYLFKMARRLASHKRQAARRIDRQQWLMDEILRICLKSNALRRNFDTDALRRVLKRTSDKLLLYQLLTLVLYIEQVEEKHGDKCAISD
jgi:hypothetical protein